VLLTKKIGSRIRAFDWYQTVTLNDLERRMAVNLLYCA